MAFVTGRKDLRVRRLIHGIPSLRGKVGKGSAVSPHQAEADDEGADAGRVPDAVRRPQEPRVAVPTAATNHPVRARTWSRRIVTRTQRVIVFRMPILTPLPHIAMHIVQ